jgi:ubiquinone/menaquinone biosynthesis C-methylase UbiE
MTDIKAYSEYENYMKFQKCRPDYVQAISKTIKLAKESVKNNKEIVLADFCCGTGSNTKEFADEIGGIKRSILVDINENFLRIAKDSGIKSKSIEIQNIDILKTKFKKECDLVFSIFAYHHVEDDKKQQYIAQIKKSIKSGGILVLTEI